MGCPSVQYDNYLRYCICGQNEFPSTNTDLASFCVHERKKYGESYGEFSKPRFHHNLAQNDRRDLKMGCIDASRRQLQSMLNIRV